jgi:uncharacterized membrane protein YhhN
MVLTTANKAWLIAYAIVSLVDVIAEGLHATTVAFVAVLLAMPALIGFIQSAEPRREKFYWLIMTALVFSWLGDWVGDLISPHVVVKIVFFFIGHIFFVSAFLPYRRTSILHRPVWLAGYVLVIGGLLVWIVPHAGRLGIALVAYGCMLGAMAVLATGVNRLTGIGGAIFVTSDLTIAVTEFVFPGRVDQAELMIMGSYLLAQLLIVLGVIFAPALTPMRPTPPDLAARA